MLSATMMYRFYVYQCGKLIVTVDHAVNTTPDAVAAFIEGDYNADLVEWERV